jgi:hypothetical protein
MVIPLSTGYTCPVTMRDSSDARNTAMLAISSGSIRPIRCAAAIFVTRGLPASNRPRTRSVIVAAGAMALTRTLCGANSTAIDRVIAAMQPFATIASSTVFRHTRHEVWTPMLASRDEKQTG